MKPSNEQTDLPRRVHLTRTIGGPLMNFVIAVGAYIAWQIYSGHILLFATIVNLLLSSLLFLPAKGFDGEIFWRELRQMGWGSAPPV